MRILLDECVPRRFRRELSEHEVRLGDQQNISRFAIAVVILMAKRNKLEFLIPLAPELRKALEQVKPGELRRVEAVV